MEVSKEIVAANLLNTLYKRTSTGKVQSWTISVFQNADGHGVIKTEHGQVGGKMQTSEEIISSGKNIGRSNETTPFEQAVSEAESRWTKQRERKGYVVSLEDLDKDARPGAEPMLAHRFDKFPEKVEYPCAIQPKLDGHRCIAVFENGETKLFSRQRKPITGLPHVEAAVTALLKPLGMEKLILDGELYNHDYKHKFEQLTSFIRSSTPKEGCEAVQYHIYDVMVDKPYSDRLAGLRSLFETCNQGDTLKLVDTREVYDQEAIVEAFARHREEGFEGSMLRNLASKYVARRSYDLLKVKTFLDEEFKVVGIEEGRGKMAGHAIFVCQSEDGSCEFRAKMKGALENLAEYFQNPDKYVGRIVTVQFQDWTADGIPRFPVAVRFREDV